MHPSMRPQQRPADLCTSCCSHCDRSFMHVCVRVGSLFVEAGCDTAAVKGLLGGSGVQDSNLVQYLGIIEQRAHELLQVLTAPACSRLHGLHCSFPDTCCRLRLGLGKSCCAACSSHKLG